MKTMKITFGCLLLLALNLSMKAQSWSLMTYPGTQLSSEKIDYLYFKDASNGVLMTNIASNFYKKTTNGGQSWTNVVYSSAMGAPIMESVFPIDEQNVVGVGSLAVSYVPPVANGYFFRSTDAGATWTQTACDSATQFSNVYFSSNANGIATGINAAYKTVIAHTTDGGVNWNLHKIDTLSWPGNISFIDAN